MVKNPSESGQGQLIARCPSCHTAVWSNYDGPLLRYVRVGTLDSPEFCPPDVHIFTASKQPWVVLPERIPAVEKLYEKENIWSKESLTRLKLVEKKLNEAKLEVGRKIYGNVHIN